MPLVRLQDGPSQWADINDAAHILWRASTHTGTSKLCETLAADFSDPSLSIKDLHSPNTGLSGNRRVVVVRDHDRITLAFEGSHPNDLHRSVWTDGKGPNWWELPYPVYTDGNRVHRFYRDVCHDMRAATLEALTKAVAGIASKGRSPREMVIAGFSMGGGISTLAFMEITEHIRSSFGETSPHPQDWAKDENLGSLIQHRYLKAAEWMMGNGSDQVKSAYSY